MYGSHCLDLSPKHSPLLQLIQLQFISFNQKKVSPYLSTFLANGHR